MPQNTEMSRRRTSIVPDPGVFAGYSQRRQPGRRCTTFPFVDLPPELQLCVLGFLDPSTLQNALVASSLCESLYELHAESLLRSVTSHMGRQIQNLMLTTFSIRRSIQRGCIPPGIEFPGVKEFLEDHLDTEKPRRILCEADDFFEALSDLASQESEISALVEDYARDTYKRACSRDNPGAIHVPLVLSFTERHRITRAFWRLKIYGHLFYDCADRFLIDFDDSYAAFLDRLSAFEIDEMVTAYQYMVRYRLHFTSAFPHTSCPLAMSAPCRNRDPFECSGCQGRHLLRLDVTGSHVYQMGHLHRKRRNVQAFWQIVEDKYLSRVALWADTSVCRSAPVKTWDDVPEPNEPNEGWKHCEEQISKKYLTDGEFRSDYRNLGFCFWDISRLEGWDFFNKESDLYERAGIVEMPSWIGILSVAFGIERRVA